MFSPLSFAAGALAWSTSEYCIHRFIGHGPKRKRPPSLREQLTPSGLAAAFNDEHLQHHADPMYFAPTSQKIIAATAALFVSGALASLLFGPRRGVSFALGFGLTYAGYEVLHRRVHTHKGSGRYGRWMRRHHLYHHHKTPRANHGVTSPLWDIVAGTHEALPKSEPLRIPRKHAPRWLLDEQGEVAAEFTADYQLVGPSRRERERTSETNRAQP
jgi:hypothetical protein